MDILRTLLCIGLAVLSWNLRFRGIRPLRDFVLWGIAYPFHFLLMALLILVIWGAVGADFGLQGLFLEDNPLSQFLIGAAVMLLFATLIVHDSVLDPPGRWRNNSLKTLVQVLRDLNALMPSRHPLQGLLRNGFLERFTPSDLDAIHRSLQLEPVDQRSADLDEMLRDEPFRLLVSPAVLLIKGFMLVALVGVVPAIVIPALKRQPVEILERLPWLLGVVIGQIAGILLACRTTRWAAEAAGWDAFEDRLIATIRAWAGEGAAAATAEAPRPTAPGAATAGGPPPDPTPAPRPWMAFLLAFFAIHLVVNVAPPDSLTSRWIDWPERTYIAIPEGAPPRSLPGRWASIPWTPIAVLLAEAAAAGIAPALLAASRRSPSRRLVGDLSARSAAALGSAARLALDRLSRRRWRWGLFVVLSLLAVAALASPGLASPERLISLWDGLWGFAFLAAFLSAWLVGFRIATLPDAPGRARGRASTIAAAAAVIVLVLAYLAGAPDLLVGMLAFVAALAGIAAAILPTARLPRLAPAIVAIAALAVSTVVAWRRGELALEIALWVGLATLVLGSVAIKGVRRRPNLVYPLTLIVAYVAFAIPYDALPEPWQAAMPAAGSIACMVGLVAAIDTIIAFLRPRSSLLVGAALLAAIFLFNGNAWFVDPNEFKATFPNMESYYALPLYLDSRDYFRETTPSAVRLRSPAVAGDFDRMQGQNDSERLATAFVRRLDQRPAPDGGHRITLVVDDPRGRLRAAVGEEVRLAAEEWYTTDIEGDDGIVLAEEGLNRKIFRWLRYEKLHLIRDGIIRGPEIVLAPEGEPAAGPAPGESPGAPASRRVTYAPFAGPGGRRGLRLRGLAPAYRAADAQYTLISMYWSGRVASVEHSSHLDTDTIEFEIPPGAEPLDPSDLRVMGSWLERCHLDPVRRAETLDPRRVLDAEAHGPIPVPPAARGDCYVLEDGQDDAPIPVGVYLSADEADRPRFPAFARFWPTRENLELPIREHAPAASTGGPPSPPVHGRGFVIRPAHDRGVFASLGEATAAREDRPARTATATPFPIALYNPGRVRPGDRLILTWHRPGGGPSGPGADDGGVFEVREVGDRVEAQRNGPKLPPGYARASVRPVAGAGRDHPDIGPAADGRSPSIIGQWQLLQPLNNTEVLTAWKRLVGRRWTDQKPKLVIVTVSGGGIRASVWTSVVLRKLEQTLGPDFPYHVRLVTGASGGMVGGSYYVTSLGPPSAASDGRPADASSRHAISLDDFVEQMATDQLDSVAGRLAFADLLSALNPFLQQGDRGRTLEETWIRWTGGPDASPLARPLQSFAADERLGRRPSMVYTPMMVEDGRRLLVSNLDLAFATRNVGGLLVEPSSRKIERPAYQGADLDTSIHDEDDVFSLSAVEFFRLFPEAHDFRVTTAVRMSASFPWVSPAISLPTLPPRRVVDAGYYDNYGVNLAALWLSKMRPWLEAHTSGVLVVQIRDHVSQGARTEIDFDRLVVGSALDRLTWHADRRLLTPGLQAISTPLLGIANARQWTMSFRNDEQVDLLDLLFDDERGRDFFRTVVFECPVEVSLNWTLKQAEKEILMSGFGPAGASPREGLARARDYLIGRDSYDFHKWKIDHRNDSSYAAALKARYDAQLEALGVRGTHRLTPPQSQQLYESIIQNLKRLELLRDWWSEGQATEPATNATGTPIPPARPAS